MDIKDTYQILRKSMGIKQHSDNLPWHIKPATRLTLASTFKDLGYTSGVEIGTKYGRFAEELCKRNPQLKLTCVDPWVAYHSIGQERQDKIYTAALERLANYPITIVKRPSLDVVDSIPDKSLDFVFIDGDHHFDAAVMDIIKWAPKVRSGGIVAVHDYTPMHWGGVVEAVDGYTRSYHIDPWFITYELEPTAFWIQR